MVSDREMHYIRKIITKSSKVDEYHLRIKLQKKFQMTKPAALDLVKELFDSGVLCFENESISINILANTKRKQIFLYISKFPGIYLNELKKRTNLESGQLLWHLGVLLNAQLVEEHKIGNITAFSKPNCEPSDILLGILILKDTFRRLISYLYTNSIDLKNAEIYTTLDFKKSTLTYNLKKLVDFEIISISGESGQYYIKPDYTVKVLDFLEKYKRLND